MFLADPGAYDRYLQVLRDGLTGSGSSHTWGGHTFGLRPNGQGTPPFHRYANQVTGEHMLRDLLDSPLPQHADRSAADVLRDNLIELWLEPGKALADQAGITLCTVEFVKRSADGELLVTLDLGRDSITPADQEVFTDPVFAAGTHPDPTGPHGVYLAGNLCLERDLITRRKVWLDHLPKPGDLLIFVNTAAYQMDLSSSRALGRPLLPKIIATAATDGFLFTPDPDSERIA